MARTSWFLLALAACGDPRAPTLAAPTQAVPGAKQLRVMTYNVNFGMTGNPETIAALAGARPDVAFLQETNDGWERALVDKLGGRYPYHRFHSVGPRDWIAGGMGVLSRYPIASAEELTAPGAIFIAQRVVLDTPLGRIQVVNLHLHPPVSRKGSWLVGFFTTRDDRGREIQYHLEAVDPKLPALLVGDFNEEGDGKAIAVLTERGYADAVGELFGGARTWEWPLKGGVTLKFQLDHVMHDAHFVPVTGQIVEAGRSDHKPVWIDFERMDP